MVNPIYQQDEELLLNPFGSRYLPSGAYTDVNSNEFIVQEDTVISVLTGGDATISENSIDYKTSMNLSGVTLKKGALIVAPVGEAFKSITIDSGSIMAYNCVVEGSKITPFSFGNALEFDGANDFVSFTTSNLWDSGTTNLSASMWIKRPSDGVFSAQLGRFITAQNRVGSIWYTDDNFYFVISPGAATTFGRVLLQGASYHNVWVNISYSFNGSGSTNSDKLKVWVNGTLQTLEFTGTIPTATSTDDTLKLGGQVNLATTYDTDIKDNIGVWDGYSISQSDVDEYYNNGLGMDLSTATNPPNSYYKLNGSNSDLVAIDSGTAEQDGTLNNFTKPPEYWVAH